MFGWKELVRRLVAVLMPERCVFCGDVIPPLHVCCDACRETLLIVTPPICTYCGRTKEDCMCRKRRYAYDKVAAVFYYCDAGKAGVLRLKRYDDPQAIDYFADQMAAVVRREHGHLMLDGIAYVPMTKRDERKREYNQGALLARALSKRLNVPMLPVLKKLYQTNPQKATEPWYRSGNVLGVFDVTDEDAVRDKTILLVDDLLTTGATLHECAKMLKIYGAKAVPAVALCVGKPKKKPDEL